MARKAAKPKPGAELAKQIYAVLEQRATTADYPCVLKGVAREANPDVSDEEILVAAKAAPLKKEVVVAFEDEPDSLVALKADKEKLAGDDRILRELLSRLCSPQLPHVPVDSLKPEVASSLRAPFARAWKNRIKQGSLPEFVRSVLVKPATGKGKGKVELHDVRFPLPWVALSEKLVEGLKSQQVEGPRTFTLADVAETAAGATESLIRQAMQSEPFSQAVRSVRKDGTIEWFAFSNEADSVVKQDAFLKSMLHSVCTTEAPEIALTELKKQLSKDLKSAFADHWLQVVGHGQSRPFFDVSKSTKANVVFRDTRFPRREVVVSEKLVTALQQMKSQSDLPYPCTFAELCKHVGPEARLLIASAATQLDPYRSRVVSAFSRLPDSPIAFLEDVAQLAESPLLLAAILTEHIKADHQAASIEKLSRTKGLHGTVQPYVRAALQRWVEQSQLPAGIGALRISKKWHLFFLKDVASSVTGSPDTTIPRVSRPETKYEKSASTPAATATPQSSFASDFVPVFDELDRKSGHQNYLKLLDLRNQLRQYDRPDFDRGILDLCRTRQFGLEGSEGSTVKLTDEERAAGIVDAGSLLVYCRRRK